MRKIFLAITILLLFVSAGYCQEQPLQLTIKSDKEVYEVDESINIKISLKNVAKEAVVVNAGALDYLTLFLKFKILDTNNNIEIMQIPRAYKPPQFDKSKDFSELKPGQFVDSTVDILGTWLSQEEGNYSITAIYDIPAWCNDIVYEHKPEFKKIDMNAWIGTLTSNTITIEVAEKEKAAIITDKIEYEQGEVIEVSVRNTLNKSIWYVDFPQPDLHFWGLERFEGDRWQDLAYTEDGGFRLPIEEDGKEVCYIFMYERPIGDAVELKSDSETSFEWNQKICPYKMASEKQPFEPVFIEEGRYRFIFRYGLSTKKVVRPEEEPWKMNPYLTDIKIICSNEFTIK